MFVRILHLSTALTHSLLSYYSNRHYIVGDESINTLKSYDSSVWPCWWPRCMIHTNGEGPHTDQPMGVRGGRLVSRHCNTLDSLDKWEHSTLLSIGSGQWLGSRPWASTWAPPTPVWECSSTARWRSLPMTRVIELLPPMWHSRTLRDWSETLPRIRYV